MAVQSAQKGTKTQKTITTVASIRPTLFGKYTLIAKLGHGGMGEVFLALAEGMAGFRKMVVIKRLHPHFLEDSRLIEMFLDEARLASRLNHPNVVSTTEIGEVDGLYYLAMDYLEGQSLDRVFRRARIKKLKVPLPVLCQVVMDALDGLHYAHELKDYDGTPLQVVHRDVSPGNIFVTYEGTSKLLDFGVAKATTQRAETQTGAIKGKISYMAPEQVWSGGEIDRRADLWSSGMVLYEGLTGTSLFKEYSDVETLKHLLNSPIEPLLASLPEEPEVLVRAIRRVLKREREERFGTAVEMRRALEPYLGEHSGSRADVGAYLRELFSDTIDQRKSQIASLIEGANSSPPAARVEADGDSGEPTVATVAMGTGAGQTGSFTQPQPKKRVWGWIAVGAAALLALVFWTIADETDPQPPSWQSVPKRARRDPPPVEQPSPTKSAPAVTASESAADAGAASAKAEPTKAKTKRRRGRRGRRRGRDKVAVSGMTRGNAASSEPGFLIFDTTPWSSVSWNGRVLGETPLLRHPMPPGDHVLTLRNGEAGITKQHRVTIKSGEVTRRRISLQ